MRNSFMASERRRPCASSPPRQGMPIDGGGQVTSGTHSPSLDVGIGMGYVPAAQADVDSELAIDVRGTPRRARVVKKPIYRKES